MTPLLPEAFLQVPLAHRGYHGRLTGVENSREAIANAVAHGYGIELDLQLSSDGQAMVFHDETLSRMTGKACPRNSPWADNGQLFRHRLARSA